MEKYSIIREGDKESYIKYMDAKNDEEASMYYIEILSDCNLRCNMCPFSCRELFHRKHGMMDEEKFIAIIDKIAKVSPHAKVHLYHHCEPMLHPSASQFVKIVKQHGLKCGISTSLNIIKGLKEMTVSGLDEIIISVSGFYQTVYEKSHVGGNIEKVKENLVILKNLLKNTEHKVDVLVSYHMYLDNIGSDYKKMQELIHKLGYTFLPIWSRSINLEMNLEYLRETGLSRWSDNQGVILGGGILPAAYYETMERMVHKPDFFLEGEWANIEGDTCPCDRRIINIHWDGKIEACSWGFDDRLNEYGEYLSVNIDEYYEKKRNSSICKECLKNNVAFYMNYDDLKNVERIAYDILKNKTKEGEVCPEVFGKDMDEIKTFCKSHEHIFIYGAGKSGRNLRQILNNNGVSNIEGYIVSNVLRGALNRSEDTIISFEELKDMDNRDIGVIIAMKRQCKAEIGDKVIELSNDVIYAAEHLLY